jgi:hypothetical protein
MAEYDAGGPGLFPSAEAVGMKRAREDGFDAATEAGQQPAGPWPGYPGENVYRLVVPVNRVSDMLVISNHQVFVICLFEVLRVNSEFFLMAAQLLVVPNSGPLF